MKLAQTQARGLLLLSLLMLLLGAIAIFQPTAKPVPKIGYGWMVQHELHGLSESDVRAKLGLPEEIFRRSAARPPMYTGAPTPPSFDRQWIIPTEDRMGHTLVYFRSGKVVRALLEHSDF